MAQVGRDGHRGLDEGSSLQGGSGPSLTAGTRVLRWQWGLGQTHLSPQTRVLVVSALSLEFPSYILSFLIALSCCVLVGRPHWYEEHQGSR